MDSKYRKIVRQAIDDFWMQNHFPPTIRDLVEMSGGTASTSHIDKLLDTYDDIRIANGKPIPQWVDQLFSQEEEMV